MKSSPKYIIRVFSVFLALLLLNISISSNFSVAVADNSKSCIAKAIPNNIESLFELLAEVGLGFDNLLTESERDNSPINEEIKVSNYLKPKTSCMHVSMTEAAQEFGAYICPKYSFIFEINPPPPKV